MSRAHDRRLVSIVFGLATLALGACAGAPDVGPSAESEDGVSEEVATGEAALINCDANPSATACTGADPKLATNLTILAPHAGDWGSYYFSLRGRWDDGRSTGGRTSSLVWTLSFDRDGAGSQPVTTITMAQGTFSATYNIPYDLVPINDCWPIPGTVTLRGTNAYGKAVSSRVTVDLYNGACWIN